jgi:hypothetical protein
MSRTVPLRPTFTFSNGAVATLERVGPLFAMPIMKAYPDPEPPLAPGISGEMQPNRADPDYEEALQKHQEWRANKIQDAIVDACISDDFVIDQEAVARVKRIYARAGVSIDEEDNRMIYLKYCCIGQPDELNRLLDAVRNYSTVSEAQIEAASAMFQDNGERPADPEARAMATAFEHSL